MPERRRYLNFTTPVGVNLAAAAQSSTASFLIHETGFLPALREWNHEGVDSPFWRFYHNPKPGAHIRVAGEELPLGPERVMLIPANTIFDCCLPRGSTSHFWIHFTVSGQGRKRLLDQPVSLAVDAVLKPLLQAVVAQHGEAPETPLRLQRLHHLAASLLHASFSQLEVPLVDALPPELAELVHLIERAPHARLNNASLAERVGMRVEAFIRWFREHLQETPAAYVTSARVRLARQQLALTGKSIEQIANATGFPNRHYFTRVFTRQVGCGPAEFRARQQRRRGL